MGKADEEERGRTVRRVVVSSASSHFLDCSDTRSTTGIVNGYIECYFRV